MDQYSDPGETEGQFRARLKHETREQRDGDVEKLRKKYGPKIDVLKEKERKAEQKVAQERTQASGATLQAAVKVGASLLEAFLGRKTFSATNIQRAASSARAVTKVSEEKGDVGRAQETLSTLQEQREALEQELQSEIDKLADSFDADALKLGDYEVKPRKSDVTVDAISLCWFPFVIGPDGIPQPAF